MSNLKMAEFEYTLPKEDIQIANRHEKMINVTNNQMQIKIILKYDLTLIRMSIISCGWFGSVD